MQNLNRRDFIAAGSAALGFATFAPNASAALTEPSMPPAPPSDEERRALIATAKFGLKEAVTSDSGMVICSHPLVARIGVDILRVGGNAADAYLAAALAQTIIEPHMTTITGFLGLTYFNANDKSVRSIDGIANVPMSALPSTPAHMYDGRSAVVPGWWAGFELALKSFASLPKGILMAPAIHYARGGFELYPFLWGEMFAQANWIGKTEGGWEIYFCDGHLRPLESRIVMVRAADTLERLLDEGNDYFYLGAFAQHFCEVVQGDRGVVTPEDFAAYEAHLTEPTHGSYRGLDVYASPAPGGLAMVLMLNMLEQFDIQKHGPPTKSVATLLKMMRILQLGRAERARWTSAEADELPTSTLLSKDYAASRLALLDAEAAINAPIPAHEDSNHITIVDAAGNVATGLHTSGAHPWQNGLFVDGISISAAGYFGATPRPGRRQRSNIAENMFFRDGRPVLACGSPSVGLSENIMQNLVHMFDFGTSIFESVNLPRFGGSSYVLPEHVMIEADMNPAGRAAALKRGMKFEVVTPWNWHHGAFEGIFIDSDGRQLGRGDPRRNSVAMSV